MIKSEVLIKAANIEDVKKLRKQLWADGYHTSEEIYFDYQDSKYTITMYTRFKKFYKTS